MKPTLVIGASTNPARYSNIAINRLRESGYDTLALGLREGEVAGVEIETDRAAFEPGSVDTITLYLGPARQVDYYDYIIKLKPRRVIFNPGTENPDLMKMLREAEIEVVIACTLVMLSTAQY